jgi:hypothetical protein
LLYSFLCLSGFRFKYCTISFCRARHTIGNIEKAINHEACFLCDNYHVHCPSLSLDIKGHRCSAIILTYSQIWF